MTTRRFASACLQLTGAVVLSACAPAAGPDAQGAGTVQRQAAGGPSPESQSPVPSRARDQESTTRIVISVRDQRFAATLDDSAASRDLLAQLPLTVAMADHGGVEKTGRLPLPLSLDRQPDAGDPAVGDIGYYAPGQDLVLYYGDQSSYPGIVVLGRMDGDAAERLAALDGSVTTVVEAVDD